MSTQHHQHSIYEPAQKTKNPDPRVILSSAFSHIQCGDLIQSQSLIVIPPNSSVQEACEILTNHGIYYAPVQSTHNPTSYDGAFTFRSSCHFLLDHFRTSQRRKLSKSNSAIRQPSSGTIGPCKLARDYVTIGFVQCKYDNSVCQAAKLLRNRSHRMAIVNAEGKLIGVLTQSMVFRRFIQPFDNLDKLFPKQLCDQFPFWFKKPLYSLSEKDIVLTAFGVLYEMDVSCLPITGENGKFVSSIAMRDIQEIFTSKQHDMMYSEMHDFVVYMSNKSTENHNCIVVQKTCTFSHAIQNMTKTKQHCVWVVDEKSRPVGVLSISDVITYLCSS